MLALSTHFKREALIKKCVFWETQKLTCPLPFPFSWRLSVEQQSSEKGSDRGMEIPKRPCRHQCGDGCPQQEDTSLGNACQRGHAEWELFFFGAH